MNCIDYFSSLLSRREYSSKELQIKGKEKGFTLEEIDEAIERLQSQDYQSDTRFVMNMIRSYSNKYGKGVIKRKCLEKGIKSDFFDQVWSDNNEDESDKDLSNLKNKIMRKYNITDFQNIDPKTKGKIWNYLQYRGFNPAEIIQQFSFESDE
ncbi:MAG TPA: regulatory protein RecX [Allocoleopsis sp.]